MAKKPEIKLDPHNTRLHSDDNKKVIEKSLTELGAGRSIVIDNENFVVAGNGVYEQAEKLGIKTRIIESDGTELVVIKRTDLKYDDENRRKLAIADNSAADLSEMNFTELTEAEVVEWSINIDTPEEVVFTPKSERMKSKDDNHYDTDFEKLAGYHTAINRNSPSTPIKFLTEKGLLVGKVLDYGCGMDVHEHHKFDPMYEPNYDVLKTKYDTVICNYVFNVIPLMHNRFELLTLLKTLVHKKGNIYISIFVNTMSTEETGTSYQCAWKVEEWTDFFDQHAKVEIVKAPFLMFKINT